jgi:hypothetical protein
MEEQMRQKGMLGNERKVNVGLNERVASVVAGTVLFIFGLRRLPLIVIGMFLGSGYLIYRGITGRCIAFDLMGVDTSEGTDSPGLQMGQEQRPERDSVQETLEQTFPASDPPAWTAGA